MAAYLKDRRVDRILRKQGIENAVIFYSPISLWLKSFALAQVFIGEATVVILMLNWRWIWTAIPLILIAYLLAAHRYNSIAFTENALLIINPNFPFRKFKSIYFQDIRQVTIAETKWDWPFLLGIYSNCYLQIEGPIETKRYYCAGQAEDDFDGNETKNTIDQLPALLHGKDVKCEYKL